MKNLLFTIAMFTFLFQSLFSLEIQKYERLLSKLENAKFIEDKLNVLKTSTSVSTFTCAQVVGIISEIKFSDDKIKVLELLSGNIIDPENKSILASAVQDPFNEGRVKKIVANIKKTTMVPVPDDYVPPPSLKYKDAWTDEDVYALKADLKKEMFGASR